MAIAPLCFDTDVFISMALDYQTIFSEQHAFRAVRELSAHPVPRSLRTLSLSYATLSILVNLVLSNELLYVSSSPERVIRWIAVCVPNPHLV
jgi:hypothetical protein